MYVSVEWRIIMDDICIIGIAGGTASGKTTIVNKLKDFINAEYKAPVLATIVEIKVGNRNFGISAGTGEISMTIRAQYTEDLQKLQTLLLDYSKS